MMAAIDHPSPRVKRLEQVPTWFEEWEKVFSRFREDSELSMVNHSAGIPVYVSDVFWDVFQIALAAEKNSDGLVTPMILDSLVHAGYQTTFNSMAREKTIPSNGNGRIPSPASSIHRESASKTLCLPADLHLDFGGVVKGWAAQQAVQRLRLYGSALVNAGGDIAISGLQADGQPWPVAVADPFDPENDLEMLCLGRCGVATSGKDYRQWKQNGIQKHHIIDPRTGEPADTNVLSATVIAPSVIDAEMAAKVVLISGSQIGLEWLEANKSMAGILVLDDGQRLDSQRIEKYIWR